MKIFKFKDFIFESRNMDDRLYFYSGKVFRIIGLKDILDNESLLDLERLKNEYNFDDWARATFVCKEMPLGGIRSRDLDKDVKKSLKIDQGHFYITTKDKEGIIIEDDNFIFTDKNDNTIYLYIFEKNKNESVRGGRTRQIHGFNYETNIKSLNKLSVKDAYTSRWDAKGDIDQAFLSDRIERGYSIIQVKSGKRKNIEDIEDIDSEFKGNYLWNIKNIKSGSGIDMGDLLRISGLTKTSKGIERIKYSTQITHFILCIGFWEGDKNNIVSEYIVHIDKTHWEKLLPDFVKAYLRNPKNSDLITMYNELPKFRTNVKKENEEWQDFINTYRILSGNSAIKPRFKRDSKGQLRIQSGITNIDFITKILASNNYIHIFK